MAEIVDTTRTQDHVTNDAGDCISTCPACAGFFGGPPARAEPSQSPQGECSHGETTSKPVVIMPQGNAGGSPAPLSSKQHHVACAVHFGETCNCMHPRVVVLRSASGDHVSFEDYLQLEAEVERLRTALTNARKGILTVDDILKAHGFEAESSARNLLMCACPDEQPG